MHVRPHRRRALLLCVVFAAFEAFGACAGDPDALDQEEQDALTTEAMGSASAPDPAARVPIDEDEPAAAQTEAELLAALLHELETSYADAGAHAPLADEAPTAELDGDAVEFARELAEQLDEAAPTAADGDASSPELVVQ